MYEKPILTTVQYALLCGIVMKPKHVSDYYKPAIALVSKGYAKWNKYRQLEITKKGVEAL